MPIFLMINKNMGFNMPKDRIVNIVNISDPSYIVVGKNKSRCFK